MKMRKSRIQFLANQQIDWQAMYQANQNPILDADGNISGYEAAKSLRFIRRPYRRCSMVATDFQY
jgi:hypothetical protein